MGSSLFTGLSGLRSFETYLDVVGNNIANSNTVGFRSSRVSFGDLLSITSPGASPTSAIGGRNPRQVGLGVGVKSIDLNTTSGSLLASDRNLDLTVFGPGMFVVNDGAQNLFTRAGSFGFDADGTLVDLGTGFRVQSAAGTSIVVPPNTLAPAQETNSVTLKGNLPATVNGPLPEILKTFNPFQTGTAATVSGATAAEKRSRNPSGRAVTSSRSNGASPCQTSRCNPSFALPADGQPRFVMPHHREPSVPHATRVIPHFSPLRKP